MPSTSTFRSSTEKSENSLKFFGDLFASRIYKLAAQKLGLNEWKTLVNRQVAIGRGPVSLPD